MKLPGAALPWIVAAGALLVVGLLLLGLHQGAMYVPMKGPRVLIQQASNPLGFYLLALCYAALAGGLAYVLWLLLRAGRPRTATQPPSQPISPLKDSKRMTDTIEITQDGRGGRIIVTLATGTHEFWWEFGGGDCVALISVPTPEQWPTIPALAAQPRTLFLQTLASEVGRRQCPRARITVGDDAILFTE